MPSLNAKYASIEAGGGDTATPLNLQKRIALIQQFVDIDKGTKIIDCGCGAGEYVLALRELGGDVYGIEYSEGKVAQFKSLNKDTDRVSVGNIEHISFDDNSFDVALLNEVLEHVQNDLQALREIHRILKPEGFLLLFSPNRFYPFETHGVFLKNSTRLIPHFIPLIPYVPLNVGSRFLRYWARNYWPHELRRLVTSSGFTIIHTTYIWQTFENISGRQPLPITLLKPLLRRVCAVLEKTRFIRTFGVSQVIVAKKLERTEALTSSSL